MNKAVVLSMLLMNAGYRPTFRYFDVGPDGTVADTGTRMALWRRFPEGAPVSGFARVETVFVPPPFTRAA